MPALSPRAAKPLEARVYAACKDILSQQLNFNLFGFLYLVGMVKFNLISPWLWEKWEEAVVRTC